MMSQPHIWNVDCVEDLGASCLPIKAKQMSQKLKDNGGQYPDPVCGNCSAQGPGFEAGRKKMDGMLDDVLGQDWLQSGGLEPEGVPGFLQSQAEGKGGSTSTSAIARRSP